MELKVELQQQRVDNETSISELRHAFQTIKEENITLRAQITKVKEDASNIIFLQEIMQIKEEVEINKAAVDNHRQKHTVTNTLTYTESQPLLLSTQNTYPRPQTNKNLPNISNKQSSHTDNKNSTQPSIQTTNTIETQPHHETSPHSPTPTSTNSLPASQNPTTPDTQVVSPNGFEWEVPEP